SVAEFGWALAPCKDWPSATAYGGCGLDRGPAPNSRLPPGQRRRRPLARANPRGRFFERKWVHFRECRGSRRLTKPIAHLMTAIAMNPNATMRSSATRHPAVAKTSLRTQLTQKRPQ